MGVSQIGGRHASHGDAQVASDLDATTNQEAELTA
jgi:hypothetical protein